MTRSLRAGRAYTARTVRRHHYRPLLLVVLCAPLLWGAACATESRDVSIDPALVRGSAEAPVTIVEFADYQ
jgi:hypothetical protein